MSAHRGVAPTAIRSVRAAGHTVDVRVPGLRARLFCTIATLGTAQDITLQELRIDSFHPADQDSEQRIRALTAAA